VVSPYSTLEVDGSSVCHVMTALLWVTWVAVGGASMRTVGVVFTTVMVNLRCWFAPWLMVYEVTAFMLYSVAPSPLRSPPSSLIVSSMLAGMSDTSHENVTSGNRAANRSVDRISFHSLGTKARTGERMSFE